MLSTLKTSIRSTAFRNVRFAQLSTSCTLKQDVKKAVKKPETTSSFAMNLFRGKFNCSNVSPYPLNLDSDQKETLQMVLSPTEKFLTEVNDVFKNDSTGEQPMEMLEKFGELGAFGALVPVEFGGAGLNNSQMARLAEIVGGHDLGLGVTMGAHQSIGYKGILLYGNHEQKEKYLPDLAIGKKFASFCLTEPSSGSDANSIRSRAVKSECGKYYILNGSKIYITNGGFAEIFTVFAQTPVEQANGTVKDKVSAFIVERAFGGVSNGPPEKKMGIKGSNTVELLFENVKIPVENLLGQEGEGFKVAMNILNNGRFGIPAAMTGSMKMCIQKTVNHITNRVQFGRKLEEFGNVQEKLAQMVVKHYVTESILYMLASNMDAGVKDYQLEAAMGKIAASENAWWVCDEAIQLHGGMGFMKETGLELTLRDLRIFRIFEGANDVLRLFVALTGIQHSGKHLQYIAENIKAGGIKTLFGEVVDRVTGFSGIDINKIFDPSLGASATQLLQCVKEFGLTVEDLIKKHRKGVVDRQFELVRVADAAIDIYSMVCVLSRCSFSIKHDSSSIEHEKDITQLFCEQAQHRVLANLKTVRSASKSKEIDLITKISKDVCKHGGLPLQHPIEL